MAAGLKRHAVKLPPRPLEIWLAMDIPVCVYHLAARGCMPLSTCLSVEGQCHLPQGFLGATCLSSFLALALDACPGTRR